ncbi:MAG: glycosyltransferase family 1 protein [Microbacteriaceae bacterium]
MTSDPMSPAARPTVAMPMLNLVPGGMGGTETYASNLTQAMASDGTFTVLTVLPENAAGTFPWVNELVIGGIRTALGVRNRLASIAQTALRGHRIRRALAAADVVHYPFTALMPRPPRGRPFAVTLHDVQHLDLPELFTHADFVYRRLFYHRAARRADLVITISEFAKQSIVRHLGVPADKIKVIPLGVDSHLFVPNLGERDGFLLYPARGWAHKNHARLIEAVTLLRRTSPRLRLVLTGGNLDGLGPLPDWVDRKGFVEQDELIDLYRRAAVLVYPSLYEGFGLPPLEAMASGCPVAASNAGSIPEVCGDAAVLFDPSEPEAIAAGIEEALNRGAELSRAGVAHAATFTWERCVQAHLEIFTELIAAARRPLTV